MTEQEIKAGTAAVMRFISECSKMALNNWGENRAKELGWLFGAVLHDADYAVYALKQIEKEKIKELRKKGTKNDSTGN